MATSAEAVRKLSYKVDSDDAVRRIQNVGSAQKGVTAALKEASAASQDNEARTVALHRRYDEITRQQQTMRSAMIAQAAAAGAAMATATAANDNYSRSSSHVSDVLRIATKTAVDHAASWLATAGAVGAGILVFGGLLAILGPVILAYKALKAVIDLVSEAWELSGKKLLEWRQIAEKAAASDLSTQFFQRITKAATEAKLPVDDLAASFKNLAQVSTDKLGGSDLQNRLSQLTGAGNFKGNTGVDQLSRANNTEEKFRAIVALTDLAFAKGERLAALDLTSKFLSPAAQTALAADSEYLRKMLASADALSKTELVSDSDIGRALELQRRYDDAVKILERRWHPIQDLLTKGGIEMRAAWVGIVEAVASAVDWVTKLVMKIGDIPQAFWDYAKKGALAAAPSIGGVVAGPMGAAAGAALSIGVNTGLIGGAAAPTEAAAKYTEALGKLRSGLQNTNAVQQAMAQTNAVQAAVWKDTSKAIGDAAKATAEVRDQYDRAKDSLEKHTARLMADRDAVGLGVGAQEEFRARAQLTTAALQAQKEITPQLAAEIDRLAKAAGAAGQNLAVARAESKATFDLQTVGLTDVERQIASVNFQLYGDKWKDYGDSAVANTMRITAALKQIKDIGAAFANDLVSGLLSGKSAMDALTSSANSLGKSLTTAGINNIIKDPTSVVGYIEAGVGIVTQLVTGNSQKKQAQDAADAARVSQYSQRVAAAGVDTSTRAGAEAAQNAQFLQERLAEGKAGAKAWNQLMEAQNAERLALQKEWDAKEIAQLKAKQDAIDARNLSAADRLFAAGNDTSTLGGALAAADRKFAQERADEMKAGGEAINNLIAAQEAERLGIYKSFNDQLIADAKRAADSIRSYLEGLQFGDKSILSPQDQLGAAQSDFSRQLGMAQAGDVGAQGSITQYASTLLDQAKSYYASSSGYADIQRAVTAGLSGLIGSTAITSASSSPTTAISGSLSGIVPSISLPTASAGNDNGALFANQTQALVQAIASVGNAEIQTLKEEMAALRAQNERLIAAVQARRGQPLRPADRTGTGG